jgi:hypothetical protein
MCSGDRGAEQRACLPSSDAQRWPDLTGLAAGFVQIARPGPHRPLMRCELRPDNHHSSEPLRE